MSKKTHDKSNRPSTTNFPDLDENMSVDETTIIKRTRNALSDSSLSETVQLKTKKGHAVKETNSEDEVSNLTLDDYRITRVEFEKLNEYNQQRIINSIIAEKT
jgi:stress-induced morphogen